MYSIWSHKENVRYFKPQFLAQKSKLLTSQDHTCIYMHTQDPTTYTL
jgi:hypothetical protein